MKWFKPVVMGLLLSGAASQAMAAVEVVFVKPENFADIGNRFGSLRDAEDNMKDIKDALIERGEAVLSAGQDMKFTVTDVKLAGEMRPFGRRMEWVRVIKPLYRPAMQFSYVITEGGKTVREGKADINDMSFMDRFNRYFTSDPLRYEKPMLDDWFAKEFGRPLKVARH